MADEPINHEVIERWIEQQPRDVLQALPESLEKTRAHEHLKIAADYAHQAVEKDEARRQ